MYTPQINSTAALTLTNRYDIKNLTVKDVSLSKAANGLPGINYGYSAQTNRATLFLQRMMIIVDQHIADESFGVGQFAREAGLCRRQLLRKLRKFANQSPSQFITDYRLRRAAALILLGNETIAEIAYQTGFNTPNYFSTTFRKHFGCSPNTYRKNSLAV